MTDRSHLALPNVIVPIGDDYALAECVGPDGTTWPWILHRDDQAAAGYNAPHEDLGPLPYEYRRRLAWDKPRCTATKANGCRCTAAPAPGGELCRTHAKMAAGITCGVTGKTTGRPCAAVVDHDGDRCPKHRGQAPETAARGLQDGQGALFD